MTKPESAERRVGELWCHEVMEALPAFADGELDPETLSRVHAHLAGCDWCERFGGAYVGVVGALRRAVPAPLGSEAGDRLTEAVLRKALGAR